MSDTQTQTPAIRVLQGHTSAETAHLTFAYPFGSNRCVRREWIELSTKGAAKGEYRFVYQTTMRPFNYEYTDRLEGEGELAANARAMASLTTSAGLLGPVKSSVWNAPKASTYSDLIVMVESPLEDGTGRIGIAHETLSFYSGPKEFAAWKAKFFTAEAGWSLNDEQQKRLYALIVYSVRANQRTWAEWTGERIDLSSFVFTRAEAALGMGELG